MHTAKRPDLLQSLNEEVKEIEEKQGLELGMTKTPSFKSLNTREGERTAHDSQNTPALTSSIALKQKGLYLLLGRHLHPAHMYVRRGICQLLLSALAAGILI